MSNLIAQAEADLEFVLEDADDGFGVEFTVIAPTGTTATIHAQSTDIGVLIDPSTGVGVRGRIAEAVFRLSSLILSFGSIPGKTETGPGWIFRNVNTNGESWEFAVEQVDVDRKLGIAKIILGLHESDADT